MSVHKKATGQQDRPISCRPNTLRLNDKRIVTQKTDISTIKKAPLRNDNNYAPTNQPEPEQVNVCHACGAAECVASLTVYYATTRQNLRLGLCSVDFEGLRYWLAAIKYQRAQEARKGEAT